MRRGGRILSWVGKQRAEVTAVLRGLTVPRALLGVLGAAVIGYGAWLTLREVLAGTVTGARLGAWWFAGPLVVDFIVVPAVVVGGLVLGRVVRGRWRRPVESATLLTALLALVAGPLVSGLGRRADNPSLLDRDYAAGSAVLVALIWLVALASLPLRNLTRARRSRSGRSGRTARGSGGHR